MNARYILYHKYPLTFILKYYWKFTTTFLNNISHNIFYYLCIFSRSFIVWYHCYLCYYLVGYFWRYVIIIEALTEFTFKKNFTYQWVSPKHIFTNCIKYTYTVYILSYLFAFIVFICSFKVYLEIIKTNCIIFI